MSEGRFQRFEEEQEDSELLIHAFTLFQARIQAWMRPAVLIPGSRRFQQWDEVWKINSHSEAKAAAMAIVQAVKQSKPHLPSSSYVTLVDRCFSVGPFWFVVVWCFTPCRRLDVIEIRVESAQDIGICQAFVHCFVSGILPVNVPLAPLWNFVLCLLPGHDQGFLSNVWLRSILDNDCIEVSILEKGRKC
jgi:hypothetical protein